MGFWQIVLIRAGYAWWQRGHFYSGAWEEQVWEVCNTYAGWFWEGGWSIEVVCIHFAYLYHHCSLLVWTSWSSLTWPVISRPFRGWASQSGGSTQNLGISALTSEAHSRRQPLWRLCMLGNGFARVFSSSIEFMRVVWVHIYSVSIIVFHILNINGLNSYRLPYLYKYWFKWKLNNWSLILNIFLMYLIRF